MERIWLKNYPKNIPSEINPEAFSSVVDIFRTSTNRFLTKTAFINMGHSLSYVELDRLSRDFAAYLQNVAGLKKGDRIVLQMPNLLQYPVALFGALRAGLVIVNTNPLCTPREMQHQYNASGAKAVVILANFANHLEAILPRTPALKTIIVTELGDLLGFPKKHIVNFVVKKVKKMVPAFHIPQALTFAQVLSLGAAKRLVEPEIVPSDLAFLQYTGGTTGVSKGAMLSHRNMVANMEQIGTWIGSSLVDGEEIIVTALPLYHIFCLTVNCLAFMKIGAANLLITNPRDLPAFVKDLKKYPYTVITAVNTLFNALLHNEDFKRLDFSKLKLAVGGGMAVQRAVSDNWKKVTGHPIFEAYGLTETAPGLTANPLSDKNRIGTIGLQLPSTDIKIIDDNGADLPVGSSGELAARGPQVMSGYWQRPDETAKVMQGGWFKTGDIAVVDADGFFKIVDRKKDMILVSGFNVYPNEIEDVLAKHPGILESAAVGIADEKSGEVVKVFVVKKDPSLTVESVREYCKENLTGYKVPRFVEFRGELPKTNVGKILRRMLKESSPSG